MKKALKLIAIVFISLIILLIIGSVVLVNTVDPNDYKPQISAQVQQMTGRKLTIAGNIQWSLFPWVGLKVAKVTLGNPSGFGRQSANFATVKQANVSVRLLPLIVGKVDIGTLVLQAPRLHFITLANGKTNFDFSAASQGTDNTASTKAVKTPAKSEKQSASPMQISVKDLVIEDGSFVWDNQKNKQHVQISEFDLSGKHINTHKAFPMTLSFALQTQQPVMSAKVLLSGKLLVNLAKQRYRLSPLSVNIKANSDIFSHGKLSFMAKTQLAVDLDKQTFTLSQLNSQIDGVHITAKATGEKITTQPVVKGNILVTTFNPSQVMALFGKKVAMQGPHALTKASIKTDFLLSKTAFNLKHLAFMLDGSHLTGYLNGDLNQHVANVDLQLDKINIDNYLPSKPSKSSKSSANKRSTQAKSQSKQGATNKATLPAWVKTLRKVQANGKLHIGQLQVSGLTLTQLRLGLKANAGNIKLSPMQAQLYGGTYNGNINLNVQPAVPVLSFKQVLSHIDLGALTKALAGRSVVTGQLQCQVSARSMGMNKTALLQNMTGKGRFKVNNGVLHGIDINQQIQQIDKVIAAKLTNLSQMPGLGKGQTAFSNVSGTFQLGGGYANNQDLMLASDAFQVTGQGRVNLLTQGIDYHLAIGEGDQGNTALFDHLEKVLGVSTVPLVVSGTLSKPKVSPDLAAIQKQIVQNKGKQMIQGASQQIENAGQKLKNLFRF